MNNQNNTASFYNGQSRIASLYLSSFANEELFIAAVVKAHKLFSKYFYSCAVSVDCNEEIAGIIKELCGNVRVERRLSGDDRRSVERRGNRLLVF